ncbi:hypothetical protein HOH87_03660, partial [bacterium]|nr:hypothetical protein [bacterium]
TYQTQHTHYLAAKTRLEAAQMDRNDLEQRCEFLAFQIQDIQQHAFERDEEEQLSAKRQTVKHAHQIQSSLNNLYESAQAISTTSHNCTPNIQKLTSISSDYEHLTELTETLLTNSATLSDEIRDLQRNQNTNTPTDIDTLESRLDLIFRAKTKYKAPSLPALIDHLEAMQAEHSMLSDPTQSLETLQADFDSALLLIEDIGTKLHDLRIESARRLEFHIQTQMKDLHFAQNKFMVEVGQTAPSINGLDIICFYVSTNPGEPMKPLNQVASGGELSRIMLAIHTTPETSKGTMIFDEIDTGTGGITANTIGDKLHTAAKTSQVFCITHLAQIAKFSDNHFRVDKDAEIGKTTVTVTPLNSDEHKSELRRMVGGSDVLTLLGA